MSAINNTPQDPTAEPTPVPLSLPDLSKAAETERPKLELEILKLRLDIHKWRADEYRSRYEGLRTLEWNTILQMYAGYAAIALAFNYVHGLPQFHESRSLAWVAMTGTLIFYTSSRYLSYRIQERLVRFDQTQDAYAAKVNKELHIEPPKPGSSSLHHQYYWTYDTQFVLSTITFVGLVAYELSGVVIIDSCTGTFLVLLTIALVLVGLLKTPTERPKSDKGK